MAASSLIGRFIPMVKSIVSVIASACAGMARIEYDDPDVVLEGPEELG